MGEIGKLYERLQELVDSNAVVNFYGGCIDDSVDAEIVDDFYIFLVEKYEEQWPDWANAYIQVYSWEYQAFYEGLITYYTDFYQHTDYESIQRAAKYLTEAGYEEVAGVYNKTVFDGKKYNPDVESEALKIITTKSGTISPKYSSNGLFDENDIKLLYNFAENKLKEISEDILNGKINIKPFMSGKKTACDYCDFKGFCGFDVKQKYYNECYNRFEKKEIEDFKNDEN